MLEFFLLEPMAGDHLARRAAVGHVPGLERFLKERIAIRGALTFADFMESVLYHPNHGYYTRTTRQIGPSGDYVTAPEVHPAFGRLLGRWVEQQWEVLGWPSCFTVIEGGPGTGALAHALLEWTAQHPDLARALDYCLVERSGPLANRQRRTLGGAAARCRWIESLADLPDRSVTGCFISNELFDALPVHRVERVNDDLREVYVIWERDGFRERLGDVSTPALGQYLADLGITLQPGQRLTISLAALHVLADIARVLQQGSVLTIDFGGTADELAARDDDGVLCFARQTVNADPYRDIGNQDICVRVNFSALMEVGARLGLRTITYTPQREFLDTLGVREVLAALEEFPLSRREAWGHRRALLQLVETGELGECRVLIQARGTA